MTVHELIGFYNEKKILAGDISFKVICNDGPGNKWFFYCDQKEKPANTVEEFCSHEGIKGCMFLTVMPETLTEEFSAGEDGKTYLYVHLECRQATAEEWLRAYDTWSDMWWRKPRYVIVGKKNTRHEGLAFGPVGFNDPKTHSELVFVFNNREYVEDLIATELQDCKDQVEIVEVHEQEMRNIYIKSPII